MNIKFKYSDKEFNITPYSTKQEKELLLYISLNEDYTFKDVLETLSSNIKGNLDDLSEEEQITLLYKLRSISIGEEINLKFKCNECKLANEQYLNVSEIVTSSNIKNNLIIDKFTTVTDDNFQDFVTCNVDELDIEVYEELFKEVQDSVTKFNLEHTKFCQHCNVEHKFDITNKTYVVENMSEDSLMSLYQTIGDMVFFGHYSKHDIDGMLPFERSIFVGILNKTREDLNK